MSVYTLAAGLKGLGYIEYRALVASFRFPRNVSVLVYGLPFPACLFQQPETTDPLLDAPALTGSCLFLFSA